MRIVDHYGGEILSDLLWDQVAGMDAEKLLPSKLEGGDDSLSAELRMAMTDLLQLGRAVVFIDEFDEIASARERNPATKGVVNEPAHITAHDLTAAVECTPASVTADIRGRFCGEVDRFARV